MASIKAARQSKVSRVMGEFKDNSLRSSSGSSVTSRAQAIAIALSEGDRAAKRTRSRNAKKGK